MSGERQAEPDHCGSELRGQTFNSPSVRFLTYAAMFATEVAGSRLVECWVWHLRRRIVLGGFAAEAPRPAFDPLVRRGPVVLGAGRLWPTIFTTARRLVLNR
jgi:hypothetical protein